MRSYTGVLEQQSIEPRLRPMLLRMRYLLPALLVVLATGTELWVRIETLHAGYRLEELRSVVLKNDAHLRDLKSTYARLASPQAVEQRAKALGLGRTAPQQIRRMNSTDR